ncbi:hypothetical protein SAMN02745181_3287 [Rubritalea squalenifaciens DSM 18772]|uniref:DoxX protein n=2 Tax=Rubritalea TaxID=361050 RepID=A0A1M6PT88_9BACT|nr:hypothetical protein [Rubritalea squalenifaciens]SHK11100.1 hypothetical protein SAMN02745181_3287 [Rubritalea squalenifaciens DSM 18772]
MNKLDDSRFQAFDRKLSDWMERWGHRIHRLTLALVFLWFGTLKVAGYKSATSLIAHTVYFSTPEKVVPILGWWEIAIGLCLAFYPMLRVALLLLALRLPGTLLALILKVDVCFVEFPWVPSIEGQYLIKDFLLFGAALVLGGTIREEQQKPGVLH